MKHALSILATCLLCLWTICANAIHPANLTDGEKYYFYNVGSGRWLAAGNSWSTRASLLTHAEYQILNRQPNGKYTLRSQVENSTGSYWLGANLFLDVSTPVELTIEASGTHCTITFDDSMLGYDGSTTELYNGATGDNALWDIYSEEEMWQRLGQATSTSPIDATFLILDPNFGRNNVNLSAWTIEASNYNLSGGSDTNRCAESWHSLFTLSQTLSNAPAGIYKLVAQGFYRNDVEGEDTTLPYFYANNAKVDFPKINGTENKMTDASESFSNGLYMSSPIYVEVTEGEELTIGARNEQSLNLWCIWDNFELTYYGTDGNINDFTGTLPKEDWQKAHAAAVAALNDSTYANVAGSERPTLEAEVAKAEPTDNEGYTTATQALNTATQAFIDAAPAYNGIWAEFVQARHLGLNTGEAEALINASTTTAADIIAATQNLKLQEYQTVNAKYTFDATNFFGRWESNYSRLTGQDYADDGHTYYDVWSSDDFSPTATQTLTLPAGRYVFKVLGRGQAGASQEMRIATPDSTYTMPFIMAGDTGIGTNKAGVTSFDPNDTEGFAYDGAGRGWQWRYIAFSLSQQADVTFTISGHIKSQWLSWDVPTLLSETEVVQPNYIIFADPVVESICLQQWDSNHDSLLTFDEAEAVTSLGNAFTGNASITSFTELKHFTSLEDLGDETFRDCQKLDTLTLPRKLWRIGRRAFAGCTALRGVTIPANVVSLGYHAFSGCTSLKTVVSDILCPQPINNTVFEDIAPDATLYVQTETGYHYQEAAGWNSFANINASVYSEWYWPEDDYQTVMHFTSTDSTIVTLEKRINESDFIVNPDNTMFFRTEYALGLRKGDVKHTVALADDLYTGSFSNLWMVPCAVLDRTKQQLFIFASSKQPANNYAESGHAFHINLNNYETTRETVFTDTNWGWHSYFDCTDVEAPVVKHFSSAGYYTVVSTRNGDGTWSNETTEQIMPDEFTQQSIQRPQLLILDSLNIETETDAEPVENIVFADSIVKRICVENWDTNRDGELSMDEAAAVTDLGRAFRSNNSITSFNELQHFTGLTSIGNSAFYACRGLTSVTIPTSVTTIEISAFEECTVLTGLTLPSSVTTIENTAFNGCRALTTIIIPSSVTHIGEIAFGRTGLTDIFIPASVTSMGANPFDYCPDLESVVVDSLNTVYNDGNGSNCIIETANNTLVVGCKNTTIPTHVTVIGGYAFYGCDGLTDITIPVSVTSIGNRAFSGCASLAEVHSEIMEPFAISSNVFEQIDANATLYVPYPTAEKYRETEGWPNHFSNIVEVGAPDPMAEPIVFVDSIVKRICIQNWDTNGDGELSMGEAAAVTDLGLNFSYSFITSFDELQYFTGLTSLESEVFNRCTSLTSVTIPTSVTSIGYRAFGNCSSLTNTTIPESVTSIGSYAFNECNGLTSIAIPASVNSIGTNPFYGCKNIESITVDRENAIYNDGNGSNCIINAESNTLVTGCKNTTIPSTVTSIGGRAFSICTDLTDITIPSSVTSIGNYAFNQCTNLTDMTIPASVTSIGEGAFTGCAKLAEVHSEITEPFAISSNVFEGIDSLAILYVPYPTAEQYRSTQGWPDHFASIVEVGTPEPTGEAIAFADSVVRRICLENWDINGDGELLTGEAELVADLGEAFRGNAAITSFDELQHFTGLQAIGANAFEGCATLRNITIPANVTSLGQDAFKGTTSLITIDWQGQLPLTTQTLAQAGIESRSANQLMYVTGDTPVELGSDFAAQWIVDGHTDELVLTDGEPLLVTHAFHASKATYSRVFSKESGLGDAAGWEALTLPFDVQRIESLTKGELQPFGAVSGTAHPFWLRLWTGTDFRSVTTIEANTPYIISMPNNRMYYDEYNIKGRVRFMADNVEIRPLDATVQDNFRPTYLPVAAAEQVYVLNDETYEAQDHQVFRPGGVFVSNLRDVRPFEAYFNMAEPAGGREYLPIILDDTTDLDEIALKSGQDDEGATSEIYDLQGRYNGQRSMVNGQLKKGIYIIHSAKSPRGKKQVVK